MKCPKCKKQLRKNAKFCPACGAKIEKKRGVRVVSVLLVITLLLGVVAIGIGGGAFFAKHFNGSFADLFPFKNQKIRNVEEAIAISKQIGKECGYDNAMSDLTEKVTTSFDGDTYYRLQQNYKGIPVYGKSVVYVTGSGGELSISTGNVVDIQPNLNLVPSVPKEKAKQAIASYTNQWLGFSADVEVDYLDDITELCIYVDESNGSHLAYKTNAILQDDEQFDCMEILVDAHTGEVLLSDSKLRFFFHPVQGDLTGQHTVYSDLQYSASDAVFYLFDIGRNIDASIANNITEAEKKTWFKMITREILVMQDNHDFPRTRIQWSGNEQPQAVAVDAYANLQTSYDFFCNLGNTAADGDGKTPIRIITGLSYLRWFDEDEGIEKTEDYSDNAFNWCLDVDGLTTQFICIGDDRFAEEIDAVAHEYMHGVEGLHSGMTYSGESGAIMEALSDIFGELTQEWSTHKATDWMIASRNIKNPSAATKQGCYYEYNGQVCPIMEKEGKHVRGNSIKDPTWISSGACYIDIPFPMYYHGANYYLGSGDNGGVHYNSTVISHAAYLMWNGIDGSNSFKMIPSDELAKLWYRAMLMMPSDCNFTECRKLVEQAGKTMNLRTEQMQCIREAFDRVGVFDNEEMVVDYEISPQCKLNIIGKDGSLYDNFKVTLSGQIVGESITYLPGQPSFVPSATSINDTATITAAEPFVLPSKGVYIVTVTDGRDAAKSISFSVRINEKSKKDSLEILTDFEKPLVVKITDEPSQALPITAPISFECVHMQTGRRCQLTLNPDGRFTCQYNGWYSPFAYTIEYAGSFTDIAKKSDFVYSFYLKDFNITSSQNVPDDLTLSEAGISFGNAFELYLPGFETKGTTVQAAKQSYQSGQSFGSAIDQLGQKINAGGTLAANEYILLDSDDGSVFLAAEDSSINQHPSDEENLLQVPYQIVRDDFSIYENGEMKIELFYDCVVLQGNSAEYRKINALIKEAEQGYIGDFPNSSTKDYPFFSMEDTGYLFHYAEGSVSYQAQGILSIRMRENHFMGGTVTCDTRGLNFNLYDGTSLDLADLLSIKYPDKVDSLRDRIWDYLQNHHSQGLYEGAKDYIFKTPLQDFNYYITSEGEIVIVFPKYSIGFGATGCIEVPTALYLKDTSPSNGPNGKNLFNADRATLVSMDSSTQYRVNIFLSNFSEQFFNESSSQRFDANNPDYKQVVDFVYTYNYLNHPDRISSSNERGENEFYITVDEINRALNRFFNFTLTEDAIRNSHKDYYSGKVFYPFAMGDSHPNFTVAEHLYDLGDGTYGVDFVIYSADLAYVKAGGCISDSSLYKLSISEARNADGGKIVKQKTGTAVIRPYQAGTTSTYQLCAYVVNR